MGRRLTKWSGGDRCHSGGFLLRIMPPSWQPVPACTRNGHSAGGPLFPATTTKLQAGHSILWQRASAGGLFYLPRRLLQAELQYFATKKIGIGRGTVATTTAQASYSTCRNDGTAAIPDFKPRLANRCSHKVKTGAICASILDFKPRLANRCSQEVKTMAICAAIPDFKPRLANRCNQKAKTGAIRASILDFKPRLANRCSQKVKTGAIPPTQGLEQCAAAGECRMGRDFGRRSRPWLREREGKHRRCAPVRSPCQQADSDAGTPPSVLRVAIFAESVENDYISV